MTTSNSEPRFLTHAHAAWLSAAVYGALVGAVASLAFLAMYLDGLIKAEMGMVLVTILMLAAMAVGGLITRRDDSMRAKTRQFPSLIVSHSPERPSEFGDVMRAAEFAEQMRAKLDAILAEEHSSRLSLAEALKVFGQQIVVLRVLANAAYRESGSLRSLELQEFVSEIERQLQDFAGQVERNLAEHRK